MHPARLTLLSALLLSPALTHAADNPGSHQHGAAQLQLAIDGDRVDLLLQSPAHNLLGFEHAPENDKQRAQVTALIEWMESTPLVQVGNADCRLEAARLVAGGPGHSGHHGKAGHHGHHQGDYAEHYREHHGEYPPEGHKGHHGEHHGEGHGKHHEHQEKSQHHGNHHNDQNDGHSDASVNQTLTCEGLDTEATLTTPLLTQYPGIEQLDVQWVSEVGQGAVRLQPGQDSFRLTQ
ncbi:MAG: DUF2796 domain-containing protein [Pseudomonadota bacterium]|nr:DUF2796 domain-containing protein [Pseudomonadota bacterium]